MLIPFLIFIAGAVLIELVTSIKRAVSKKYKVGLKIVPLTNEDMVLLKKAQKKLGITGIICCLVAAGFSVAVLLDSGFEFWFVFVIIAVFLLFIYYIVYVIGIRPIRKTLRLKKKEILETVLLRKDEHITSRSVTVSFEVPEGVFHPGTMPIKKIDPASLQEHKPITLHFLLDDWLIYVEQ